MKAVLISLAILASAAPFGRVAAEPAQARQSQEVRLAHISVRTMGEGPPVILIPGLASPRTVWNGVAEPLARGHRLVLVQINGFGGDDVGANAAPGLMQGVVNDLAGWMASNGIERAAVIGHSMGGEIGLMLARDHPERVSRLLVVDSLPFLGLLVSPSATVDAIRPTAEELRRTIASQTGDQPAPPNMSNTEAGRAQVAAWRNAAVNAVVAQAAYEALTTDLRPDLPAIGRVPVTVMYPVANAAMAANVQAFYASAYRGDPTVRFVPVADSAHFVMLDQPERFRSAVSEFLAN
jgi:pimeloyl-ACP methyl ester carboxylesterase